MSIFQTWIQILLAFIGGLYALYLLRQSNREKRTEFILKIYDKFYSDFEIRKILYVVDKEMLNELKEIRASGLLEQEADKTIRFLDFIGELLKNHHISCNDLLSFRYEIEVLLNDDTIKQYIEHLKSVNVNLGNLDRLKFNL